MLRHSFEVFLVFLKLGLTSFGGPVAHLGYFHNEFVVKKKWFDENSYADLVVLCQFLPGPASSQVGIAIGESRAGLLGAFAAWFGFTLPSALLLIAFASGISIYQHSISGGWLHGLKVVAVAIVAQAIWGMGKNLCPDRKRACIALAAAVIALFWPTALGQIGIIFSGGVIGVFFLKFNTELPHSPIKTHVNVKLGVASLIVFFVLIMGLPFAADKMNIQSLKIFDRFFRAGAFVFGGGHVVLPLLKAEIVNSGWVSADAFMAGYGATQAIPGPLFTFSAYLGAISNVPPSGWLGAIIALIGAFLPSFLLIFGALPFWERLRCIPQMRYAMFGINAAVVGLLLAAFCNPVSSSAIFSVKDFVLALLGFFLLVFWKTPPWMVVILSAVVGGLFL